MWTAILLTFVAITSVFAGVTYYSYQNQLRQKEEAWKRACIVSAVVGVTCFLGALALARWHLLPGFRKHHPHHAKPFAKRVPYAAPLAVGLLLLGLGFLAYRRHGENQLRAAERGGDVQPAGAPG